MGFRPRSLILARACALALGLSLSLAGCASTRGEVRQESGGWELCNRPDPAALTFLCLKR